MNPVVIIAIAFVLFIPTELAMSQSMVCTQWNDDGSCKVSMFKEDWQRGTDRLYEQQVTQTLATLIIVPVIIIIFIAVIISSVKKSQKNKQKSNRGKVEKQLEFEKKQYVIKQQQEKEVKELKEKVERLEKNQSNVDIKELEKYDAEIEKKIREEHNIKKVKGIPDEKREDFKPSAKFIHEDDDKK